MVNDELMLKIENVSKVYRLGEIGGTTLRDELQRLWAKMRKKEDPTKKIGSKNYNKGEKFKALDDISFEVKKGERIGIIGHNGAGKSTLLKLISRVTGPTSGIIYLNGRVASMLEVGTGFHEELTGRENVYMNGAILGMTKKEIDAKMEDIIEFSEVRQFIDTPVKRYSSGMYVKLAFSVAAHLDSEIMIMDEVLAVGDVAFQNKCLNKMKQVSEQEDRTILYVSHNMSTIRQLCDRVIVLNHGKIVFDGDVEDGIKSYLHQNENDDYPVQYDLDSVKRFYGFGEKAKMLEFNILNKEKAIFERDQNLNFSIKVKSSVDMPNARLAIAFRDVNDARIGMTMTEPFALKANSISEHSFEFGLNNLSFGKYRLRLSLTSIDNEEVVVEYDDIGRDILIELKDEYACGYKWDKKYWGNVRFPETKKK